MDKIFYLYILTNSTNTSFYFGVTHDLHKTVTEHKKGVACNYTRSMGIKKLVYHEVFGDISKALIRKEKLKDISRDQVCFLINNMNPEWNDLIDF